MARQAAKAVLKTLTASDYVTIIGFSSNANAYSSTLVPASSVQLEVMDRWIDSNIGASGGTNFRAAMQKVWQVFDSSNRIYESSSGCNKVVLFLSDGKDDGWDDNDYEALRVNSAERGHVHILTYALGSGADQTALRNMACQNNGVSCEWQH